MTDAPKTEWLNAKLATHYRLGWAAGVEATRGRYVCLGVAIGIAGTLLGWWIGVLAAAA